MKYFLFYNQVKSSEWGLNAPEALVFDWLVNLATWADHMVIDDRLFYFASRNKAAEELPTISTKPDTFYRHYRSIEKRGLCTFEKVLDKDYVHVPKKIGNEWRMGGTSEHSENFPSNLGNISESSSENFPTNKTISIDKTISDNNIYKEVDGNLKKFNTNTIQDYLRQLTTDFPLIEAIVRKQKANSERILAAAKEFAEDKLEIGRNYHTYKDFKQHFFNWSNYQDFNKKKRGQKKDEPAIGSYEYYEKYRQAQ